MCVTSSLVSILIREQRELDADLSLLDYAAPMAKSGCPETYCL